MKIGELLQLNPQHLAELRDFYEGFQFDDVEIVAREQSFPNDFEPSTFGYATISRKLYLDSVFRGNNSMHALLFDGHTDNVFFCESHAKIGSIEDRIIFKLTLKPHGDDDNETA